MENRNISINQLPIKSIANKTVMDYACDFTKEIKTLCNTNVVRQYKKAYLLIELVGESGGQMMDCHCNSLEQSALEWPNFEKFTTEPSRKQLKY